MTKQTTTLKKNPSLEKAVAKAIAELQGEGRNPTNVAVREKTGGSFRDLAPLIKAHLAQQAAAEEAARGVPDMPEETRALAQALWEQAYRAADETSAAERQAHADQLKTLEDENAELLENLGVVEEERDAAAANAAATEARNTELGEQLREQELQLAELRGRLTERERLKQAEATAESAAAHDDSEDAATPQMFPEFNGPARGDGSSRGS